MSAAAIPTLASDASGLRLPPEQELSNGPPAADRMSNAPRKGRIADSLEHPSRNANDSPRRTETRRKQAPRASKNAIRRRLSAAVWSELEKAIVSASEVTVAWLNQLDEQFGLGRKYAITRRGLRDLVFRVRVRHGKKVKSRRVRQEWTGKVLKGMVGEKGEDNPHLLGQHAYLAMVSVLYERLTTHGKDISTEELAALSKMLAEQRRAEAQSSRGSSGEEARAAKGEGELPENFGEAVKQIYGTNFQAPN